jgi:hypothetical protein
MSGRTISLLLFAVFVLATLWITWWASRQTRSAVDFYAAGRRITGLQNGIAISVLKEQGDYAMWGPGTNHSWHAEEDSLVITVRWPSLPI